MLEVRGLAQVTDTDMTLARCVQECVLCAAEFGRCNNFVIVDSLSSLVVDKVVDWILARSLDVPQVDNVVISVDEVLMVWAHRQTVNVSLVAGLVGVEVLAFLGLRDDLRLGHGKTFAFDKLLLGGLALFDLLGDDLEEFGLAAVAGKHGWLLAG